MKLFKLRLGIVLEQEGAYYDLPDLAWNTLLNRDDLLGFLSGELQKLDPLVGFSLSEAGLLPPIGNQEVWGAGVTYYRSRTARMEESRNAGGGDFYDRVYQAERPELFFKANPHRVAGHGQEVRIRRDSQWSVPEPELALVITSSGKIVGYTIGNDMSARDIEGENPLYLPQAKTYDSCCALGPGILVTDDPLPGSTEIKLAIAREGKPVFSDKTTCGQMKRSPQSLVEYLFSECSFPDGCFLLTGTGVIPPDSFSLRSGDEISISIEPIGTLTNRVR